MAAQYGMEAKPFELTVRATCMPPDKDGRHASREEFAAFLMIAREYDLNPIAKEIFAFRRKGGGLQPVVSVDGWSSLINRRAELDGIEFDDHFSEDGKAITAITCRIWRKDRSKPIGVTEYLSECRMDTEPWRKWPRRFLRHKALIQCARYAFGFSGIVDPDEAERMAAETTTPAQAGPAPSKVPPPPREITKTELVERVEDAVFEEAVTEGEPSSTPAPSKAPPPAAPSKAQPPKVDESPAEPAEKPKRASDLNPTDFINRVEDRLRQLSADDADASDVFAKIEKAALAYIETGRMQVYEAGALSDLLERYRKELDL